MHQTSRLHIGQCTIQNLGESIQNWVRYNTLKIRFVGNNSLSTFHIDQCRECQIYSIRIWYWCLAAEIILFSSSVFNLFSWFCFTIVIRLHFLFVDENMNQILNLFSISHLWESPKHNQIFYTKEDQILFKVQKV